MEPQTTLTERYQITSHLARGGMADVYDGVDTLLNRKVAIKVLHSQFSADEAFVKRFRREAQAAANLSHPNIVGIYDWGQAQNTYFIVMELVDGRSLREVLKTEGALLPRRATEIASEVAAALSVAHQAGLVHRDVKPGNILLAKDGTVKVTDFGIARAWDDSQELTRTGAVIGTATYFSPEQAQGASADERSDVYALGVVLYEMLTGRPPYTGDSPMSVAFQHVSTEAPTPSSLNPDVSTSLDAIVTKAMRKDPTARYQTAAEMRTDLLSVLRGDSVGMPALVPVVVAADGDNSTRLMTTPVPPATVPPDEVYRGLEEEPQSQWPFILTAVGLLAALAVLLFFLFRLAGGGGGAETVEIPNVTNLSQEEALARLEDDGFQFRVFPESSDEIEAGFVIRTDPVFGTEVEVGSLVNVYVSTGTEEIAVPPVVGQTLANARTLIGNAGLEVGTVEERPDADFEEGVVVEQSPGAGVEVGTGSLVNLVVSTGPEEIVIPDVTNLSERDATATLTNLGLKVTVDEEYSSTVPTGLVIRTDPAPQSQATSGDTVLIVISLGPQPVEVPNLIGTTPSAADGILDGMGLVLQVSPNAQPVADPGQDGLIVSQNPTVGASVVPGDVITVVVGHYEAPPTTTTTTAPTTTSTAPPDTTPSP